MLILITKRIYNAVDTLRSLYDHSRLLSSNIAQLTNIGTTKTLCYMRIGERINAYVFFLQSINILLHGPSILFLRWAPTM